MRRHKKRSKALRPPPQLAAPPQEFCYEGEHLDDLLRQLRRSIDSARMSEGELPEKIWMKQQFAIGVNDVTRVLERMPPTYMGVEPAKQPMGSCALRRAPLIPLQAVLLAHDCKPRWLTKHVPSLASSRKVPIIFVKDNKGGSLRLGALVNLKTAMAIGVKARGNEISKTINKFIGEDVPEVTTADTAQRNPA